MKFGFKMKQSNSSHRQIEKGFTAVNKAELKEMTENVRSFNQPVQDLLAEFFHDKDRDAVST